MPGALAHGGAAVEKLQNALMDVAVVLRLQTTSERGHDRNARALDNIIKIQPPLVFQQEHADLFLNAFEETRGELDATT